jgi:hypothetical protein
VGEKHRIEDAEPRSITPPSIIVDANIEDDEGFV